MKQKTLLTVISFVIAFSVSALNYNQFIVDGIIYEKISGTNNVKVSYDPDKAKYDEFGQTIGNTYSGIITVPEIVVYNGISYSVTEVGDFAFAGGPGLTGVTLPESITKIGMSGFYGNDGITSITLPNSVKTIGYYAFRNCYNLSSINFPEGLEVIGGDAFTHDRSLTELILPSSLKEVDGYAFCACTGVKRVILQDSDVPLIKSNFGSQTIFDQMEVDYAYIGRNCYTDGTDYLPIRIKTKELDFGDAVSSFSLSQFYPEFLEKLFIPQTCNRLDFSDFQNSTALKHIVIKDGNTPIILETYVKSTSNGNSTSYEYFPCLINCPLQSAYIGRTFKKEYGLDGTQAFYNNKTLKNLVIGPHVTSLPKYGFQRCNKLETIEFPESLESIGEGCFADCHSLKSVKIPPLLTEIAPRVFDSCFELTNVDFNSKVSSIGDMAFYYSGLTEINIPSCVKNIGKNAFSGCQKLTSLILNPGLEAIERGAFSSCESLTELTIPSTVLTINDGAFNNLSSLKKLKFEDSREELKCEYSVKYGTFNASPVFDNSLTNVEEIYMGRGFPKYHTNGGTIVTPSYAEFWGTIHSYDYNCSPVITFGTKLDHVNKGLFQHFPKITKVYCLGTDQIPFYGDNAFYDASKVNVYVPQGYVSQYELYGWSGFASLQENIKATKVSLNRTSLSLKRGRTFNLVAYVTPSNASDAVVMWESSDESIVTVSESGEIVANGIGQASVTAYLPNYPALSATCNVSVTKPDVSAFAFDKTSATIFVGTQNTLTLSIDPSDASQEFKIKTSPVDGKTQGFLDYSIDGNVITLKGEYPGYLLVEAICTTNPSIKCSAEITICSVDISESHIVVGKKASYALTPVFNPEIDESPVLTWSSSNPDIASVDSNGVITGKTSGVANITMSLADLPSISISCEVEVGTLYNRNIIVESAVSSQEYYSVRGYAGLDMYKSLSNESGKVIPIAVHVHQSDPMSNIFGNYSEGLFGLTSGIPEFILNREIIAPSPTNVDKTLFYPNQAQLMLEHKSICGFEIINTVCPDNVQNKTPLTASIGIYPGRNISEKLTITAVIVENNVSDVSSQKNNIYYNLTSADMSDFDWLWMNPYCAGGKWGQQNIPASSMSYDYVARGIYPSFNGKEAGDSWTEGTCYNSNISFELPSNITNLENCELIVMLLDSKGRVVNASSMPYAQFQVSKTIVTDLSLNKSSLNLKQGTSETLTVSVSPSYINDAVISWDSSNEDVAVVVNGVVTAVGTGTAMITARTTDGSNLSRSCEISVYPSSIAFNESDISLLENETFQLIPNVPKEYLAGATILWSSSNYGVLDIDQTGLIAARSKGQAKAILSIWTPSGQISAECNVIVNRIATGIKLSTVQTTMAIDSDFQLHATLEPTDTYITNIDWTTDNADVAIVDSNGLIHSVGQGVAHITASTTDGSNLSASCTVTVGVFAESISLNEIEKEMEVGESFILTATILPENSTNQNIAWSSSDPSIAAVYNGEIIAYSYGSAIITARTTDGTNLSASCLVSVVRRVKSITLSESEVEMSAGEYRIITATINPDNATNKSIIWTSSDNNVARVENGIIVAIADGEATITVAATDGSEVTASCNVHVRTLVSEIIIDQTSLKLKIGEFANLAATVLPDTATNADVEWTSSDDAIASVHNGLVLAHAEGEGIITVAATDGSGVKAECKFTIYKESGIESVTWDDVKVYVSNSSINIDNLMADILVRIIQPNGSEIFRTKSVGERISFRPSGKGIYFVILGNRSYNIAVF